MRAPLYGINLGYNGQFTLRSGCFFRFFLEKIGYKLFLFIPGLQVLKSKVFVYVSMIRAFVFDGFVSENVKVVFLKMLKMFTNSVPSVTV